MSIRMYDGAYSDDHWACSPPALVVHTAHFPGVVVYTHVNPTDCRCWRLLVNAYPCDDQGHVHIRRAHNLPPDSPLFAQLLRSCFEEGVSLLSRLGTMGMLGQIEFAANNAMGWKQSEMILGSETEPFVPHVHLIWRAAPGAHFLGIPFRGPPPGELFDMRHDKVPWNQEELSTFQHNLKSLLCDGNDDCQQE